MDLYYDKLWRLIEQRGIEKEELRKAAKLTTQIFTKIGQNQPVQINSLVGICEVLNCNISDVVNIKYDYSNSMLPNIDLESFDSHSVSEQFEILGYRYLHNLPIHHTAAGLLEFLQDQYACCHLSKEACLAVIEEMKKSGIAIEWLNTREPSLNCFSADALDLDSFEADELLCQQLSNFYSWFFEDLFRDPDEIIAVLHKSDEYLKAPSYLAEKGILHAQQGHKIFSFEGIKTYNDQNFLYSLIEAVFGKMHTSDLYIYSEKIPDILDFVNSFIHQFSPAVSLLVELIIKKGLTNMEVLDCLGLPAWDILSYGITHCSEYHKFLRKFRHPNNAKMLRRYSIGFCSAIDDKWRLEYIGHGLNPYSTDVSRCTTEIYDKHVNEICTHALRMSHAGTAVPDILTHFYSSEIIREVQANIAKWYDSPESTIDHLMLSWQSHYLLKNSGLITFQQLLRQHASGMNFDNAEKSGLMQLPGITYDLCREILSAISCYLQLPLEYSIIRSMIHYAESVSCNVPWPVNQCVVLPHDALRSLLRLNYRDMNLVLSDFSSGKLLSKCAIVFSEKHTQYLLNVIEPIVSGEYPVTHIIYSDFWKEYLHSHQDRTLQQIRIDYLHDRPIQLSVKDMETFIPTLFPGLSDGFRLLYLTRALQMKWTSWPTDVLHPFISQQETTSQVCLNGAYFSSQNDSSDLSMLGYVIINADINNRERYILAKLCAGQLIPLTGYSHTYLNAIFHSVIFNSILTENEQEVAKNTKVKSHHAFAYFCTTSYANCDSDIDEQIYLKYEPLVTTLKEDFRKLVRRSAYEVASHCHIPSFASDMGGIHYLSMLVRKSIFELTSIHPQDVSEMIVSLRGMGVFNYEWERWLVEYNSDRRPRTILDRTIDELNLSVRSFNCLKRAAINTVGDLFMKSGEELMKFKNMGKKSLDEVSNKLSNLGVCFRTNNDDSVVIPESILGMTIEELHLASPAYEALKQINIITVRELIALSEQEYRETYGFENHIISQIILKLWMMQLRLKPN